MWKINAFLRNNYKIVIIIVFVLIVLFALIIANINKKPKLNAISEIEYDYFIYISSEKKIGVIDKKGKIILEAKYSEVYIPNPSRDLFICYETEDEYEFLNSKGEKLFENYELVTALKTSDGNYDFEKNVLKYKENGKYGIIDYSGNKLTDAKFESIQSLKNKPGELLIKKDGKYGVINSNGEEKIPAKYDGIIGDEYYSEIYGYEQVGYIVSKKAANGILYGYIDYLGDTYLDVEYESISRVFEYTGKDVYLIAMRNGKKGVYKNSKQIIEEKYQGIAYSNTSNLFAVQRNSKYGIYNTSGKEILPVQYTSYKFAGDYISVEHNNKRELYDVNGNKVSNLDFVSVEGIDLEGCYIVKDKDGFYRIMTSSDMIEGNYTYISYAFENNFIFKDERGYYGILDLYAGVIVDAEYSFMLLIDGTNAIEAHTQLGDVDIYSNKIEKVASISNAIIENVDEKYTMIYSDTDRIYIDKNGEIVDSVEVFKDRKLYAYKENGKWGFENKNGKKVVEATYDMVTELNKYGFAGICKDNKWGVIDENGKIIKEPTYELDLYYQPVFVGKYLLVLDESYYCQELD